MFLPDQLMHDHTQCVSYLEGSAMMSDLQAVKKQAYKLSVLDRLSLAKAMIESLQEDLRPRPQLPADFVDRMIGLGKTDSPPLVSESTTMSRFRA